LQFFTETVLPTIEKKLAECRPKLQTTAAHLHIDNAKTHTSKMSTEKIEELSFSLVAQPPHSPDLAPCDFLLFGYLKQHLEGKHFTREDQVIAAVREVFDKIPLHTLQNVMNDRQYRLRQCIQLEADYLLSLKKKFKMYLIFANFNLTARTSGPPYTTAKL
jgi:transposase